MPKLLYARPPQDSEEERQVRTLARSRHAPGDGIQRATMLLRSWDGLRPTAIAAELGGHPPTVRERRVRFTAAGLDGLGERRGAGRTPRLTATARSTIIGLVATPPPGRLVRDGGGELAARAAGRQAHWPLDARTAAAPPRGSTSGRSQVRRVLLAEQVRWRQPRSWATRAAADCAPTGRRSSRSPPTRRRGRP